jgi:hypothetical protein
MKFITTTKEGVEGFNISYFTEKRCAEMLSKIIPKDWTISFEWSQILFSDVEYMIEKEAKTVHIRYNQNLGHWWKEVTKGIKRELVGLK